MIRSILANERRKKDAVDISVPRGTCNNVITWDALRPSFDYISLESSSPLQLLLLDRKSL